jgi:group I intron endonuclease
MEHFYIYCLHNEDLPEYYVGHTKDLEYRFTKHKKDSKYRTTKNIKVYKYINNNGGIDNFKMEVLDEIYCSVQEARKLERFYMELLGATLNTNTPAKSIKEKNHDFHTRTWQDRRIEVLTKRKEKFTCTCGSVLRIADRSTHYKTYFHLNNSP